MGKKKIDWVKELKKRAEWDRLIDRAHNSALRKTIIDNLKRIREKAQRAKPRVRPVMINGKENYVIYQQSRAEIIRSIAIAVYSLDIKPKEVAREVIKIIPKKK